MCSSHCSHVVLLRAMEFTSLFLPITTHSLIVSLIRYPLWTKLVRCTRVWVAVNLRVKCQKFVQGPYVWKSLAELMTYVTTTPTSHTHLWTKVCSSDLGTTFQTSPYRKGKKYHCWLSPLVWLVASNPLAKLLKLKLEKKKKEVVLKVCCSHCHYKLLRF